MDRFRVVPAAYVVVRRGDEVLLLLRANTGYMDGYWAVPAGHVEQGESAVAAAVRELKEEVGIEVDPAELVAVTAMHRTGGNGDPIDERVDFFFTTDTWTGEPTIMEPDKAAGLGWYSLDDLPDPLVPHEARVLGSLKAEALPAVIVQGFA
ncbi:ADP-ribose pyrophosphatase YjhB (NUDIX family) [Kribbella aluminosa]|uniref:ADP-ribose pyrophosphatase YjhB (NUDIX family) n=1 Tax=Kribbella aluminosa TaxID=416017 RepID=A0ABS4UI39_9ACTN|nr:NUDIX domain-containing protein [Kribbella aluminosa]MBP2351323.1 ADP-ribose pyrophosphatase YjhB (NUDIX family) [Kribbella aluminosa]